MKKRRKSIALIIALKPLLVALPYAREYGTGTLLETFDWNTFEYKTAEGY